ncbi:MarR family winged helix-turn-helix transcriptional regulator [Variovorax paradoxus]|uniref:MarR family winged helix-turn-helix transcriptional regulator n=1 Tax=Variovorax paradoxus TaxID=34073 RepID=UPI0027837BE3|nr:MarR family transcriptional regulator [Variovorax paradoxus]MDP9932776.1 DNA-binding MarR family transcriptional regulator [Variovorax paradoxus]
MSNNQPFVDTYLPALLAQASQLISAEFHEIVQANGLSVLEWRVLATLADSGPVTIGQLAQKSVSKQPTVTRLLDRMEAQGLVERLPAVKDRRLTLVRMTRSGDKMIAGLIRKAHAHEASVLEPFGANRSKELKKVLLELIALHRTPPGPAPELRDSRESPR